MYVCIYTLCIVSGGMIQFSFELNIQITCIIYKLYNLYICLFDCIFYMFDVLRTPLRKPLRTSLRTSLRRPP